ncbi:MAG TPA: hypothetical protein VJ464_06970 [Blastocatellia bacterium]|nr:hypothetical protein [Blastocatellia bacterium]
MPYQPFTLTDETPLILAGPMLRKVTQDSVTVWVALRESCTNIGLTVTDRATGSIALSGATSSSSQIGDHLHVAAVTARKQGALSPERLYIYDLNFGSVSFGDATSLKKPKVFNKDGNIGHTSPKPLCYKNFDLPSFLVPPNDWRKLRFLNGSCTKIRGEGADATLAVDRAIEESAEADKPPSLGTSAFVRPHLLMLTGDQVYCDDVAAAILRIIIDASKAIFGDSDKYAENLPLAKLPNDPVQREKEIERRTRPGVRLSIAKDECHFTSADLSMENHLLYFREYALIYLMAWSDVLWPVSNQDFPNFKEVYKDSRAEHPLARSSYMSTHVLPCFSTLKILPFVRRAFANIPTYMSMDDHEVADDSFITANWCARVLGSPVGRQAVRNALKAYAVFQAWGNTPEQFEAGQPGKKLLDLLTQGQAADVNEIDKCLALPPQAHLFEPDIWDGKLNGKTWDGTVAKVSDLPDMSVAMQPHVKNGGVILSRDSAVESLVWYYRLNFGDYQFIVNDTRTWRAYPGNRADTSDKTHGYLPCVPISDRGLTKQFAPDGATTKKEVLFIVNGLAPFDVPALESLRENSRFDPTSVTGYADISAIDIEGWSTFPEAREQYFAFLAAEDLNTKSPTERRIVILSGDIHHSYTCRMRYYSEKPMYGAATPHSAVFVLLTGSAFKNEDLKTRWLHENGYVQVVGSADNRPLRKFFFGWKERKGVPASLGTLAVEGVKPESIDPLWNAPQIEPLAVCLEVLAARYPEIYSRLFGLSNSYELTLASPEPSDWRYRLDYFTGATRVTTTPTSIPNAGKSAMSQATQEYRRVLRYASPELKQGTHIVGKNNMSDIYFHSGQEGGQERHVIVQGVWWYLNDADDKTLKEQIFYGVPFDPTPGKFDIKGHFGPISASNKE